MSSTVVLQATLAETIEQTFRDAVATVIEVLPGLLAAIAILVIGWLVGRAVYRVVARTGMRLELDRVVGDTPLGRVFGRREGAVSTALGRIGAWFVYGLAILTAANVLGVQQLSEWLSTAVSYLPALVAGTLIIVVGFVLADFLADVIARTETVTETRYTDIFADGVRVFLYFISIVIGLSTIGVDVAILNTFASAAAWGLAAGIALAMGIGLGWGSKDYVAENIDSWLSRSTGESSSFTSSQPGDDS
jgi:small-conductance mechanosensitive channel